MRHLKKVSMFPCKAADVCDNINSDYQAILCFLLQILTAFILPVYELKAPSSQ